jgi:DNA modification methylase
VRAERAKICREKAHKAQKLKWDDVEVFPTKMKDNLTILCGDALEQLRTLQSATVQCCVTSPPYFGLRDYKVAGQLGLEKTPAEYVAELVKTFSEVKRVLKSDGTLWLNLGDSYANDGKWGGHTGGKHVKVLHNSPIGRNKKYTGLKPKDLIGIPWRVAFALQADGWYLRSDIIWSKPNPMPESVTDRCTRSHEYMFHLTKSARYFYDAEAIKESATDHEFNRQDAKDAKASWKGSAFDDGKNLINHPNVGKRDKKQDGYGRRHAGFNERYDESKRKDFDSKQGGGGNGFAGHSGNFKANGEPFTNGTRNKRTVWSVATHPYSEAHFATFPPALIKPCILAGSRPRDMVLDPFGGSGTTGMVALELGRRAILIELNPEYIELIRHRTNVTPGLHLIHHKNEKAIG